MSMNLLIFLGIFAIYLSIVFLNVNIKNLLEQLERMNEFLDRITDNTEGLDSVRSELVEANVTLDDIKNYTFKSYIANRISLSDEGIDLEEFCRCYDKAMKIHLDKIMEEIKANASEDEEEEDSE